MPLAQINHTRLEREDMLRLIKSLNSRLKERALESAILLEVFDTYWDRFEASYKQVLQESQPADATPRENGDVLSEILENTRQLNRRVASIEQSKSPQAEWTAPASYANAFERYRYSQSAGKFKYFDPF